MKNNHFEFFDKLQQTHSLQFIADNLGLHKGTLNRWNKLKEVPPQYYFDLCRLAGIDINYENFSFKNKDQFYTRSDVAKNCYDKSMSVLKELGVDVNNYNFIEPSAGDGSFFNLLPKDRRIGIDIEPKCEDVIQQDFLSWKPTTNHNIVIGNPPFGLRGHLALQFINHSAKFCDFVIFILPPLFNSKGKGSCKGRVKGLNLIHSEIIDSNFYYPDGKDVSVNVVLQIWSKEHKIIEEEITLDGIIKLYSLSDGGTPSSTRNKAHLYNCDYYLPSTCFSGDEMKSYYNFEELPKRRGYGIKVLSQNNKIENIMQKVDWSKSAFRSTNGAFNLRFDIITETIASLLGE